MGEALIKGLSRRALIICEENISRARYLKKKYSVAVAACDEACAKAAVIIFAVKPQDMAVLLEQMRGVVSRPAQSCLYISIAAGLTTEFFERRLGERPRVIRAMPNMPALIGEGMTAVSRGRYAKSADEALALKLMASLGKTIAVKEAMMDAVTAVSGSGPAYVFLFVEMWIAAAKTLGFTQAQAKTLVYQTLLGSAHLLKTHALDAAALRAKVTSKGGTTQAAMDIFTSAHFGSLMQEALRAAKDRARLMGENFKIS